MKKFFQNKSFGFRIAVLLILIYVLIALVAPFIANNKPLVCSTDKGFIFPMFENKTDIPKGNCIYALIPYGPNETNLSSGVSLSPLDPQKDLSPRYRHWLGTDKLGRDVAAGIIHGTKVAIQIGFISVLFSFIFGVSLGLISGYYKDENIKFNIFQVVLSSVFFVLWMFYMVFEWQFGHLNLITIVMWFCIFLLCQYAIIVFASKIPTKIKYHFPLDTLVVKSIELRKSFPGIFILLALTTLFATHYHELNEMTTYFPRIKNFNVSVKELNNKIIFLRKLQEGGSEHSFGIHVARMAGMPKQVVDRANDILKKLEKDHELELSEVEMTSSNDAIDTMTAKTKSKSDYQLSFFQLNDPVLESVKDELIKVDINTLTPVEALMKLNDIKRMLGA